MHGGSDSGKPEARLKSQSCEMRILSSRGSRVFGLGFRVWDSRVAGSAVDEVGSRLLQPSDSDCAVSEVSLGIEQVPMVAY